MLKSELIKALQSKAHDVEVKFLDTDGEEVEVESMGFDLDLYVFEIHLCLDSRSDRETIRDIESDDLFEELTDRSDIDTCCGCNIGWWMGSHDICPLCELKTTVGYNLDEITDRIKDLKGGIDG